MKHKIFINSLRRIAILLAVIGLVTATHSVWAQQRGRGKVHTVQNSPVLAPTTGFNDADFTGDQLPDMVFFDSANSEWMIRSHDGTVSTVTFAQPGDETVAADYDGDHTADLAVVRTEGGLLIWKTIPSLSGVPVDNTWGVEGEMPVQGDFDGDGKTDMAVWRPSDGRWSIFGSLLGQPIELYLGDSSDKAVPSDYDGDGRADIAVFHPLDNTLYFYSSFDQTIQSRWFKIFLIKDDAIIVPADYDGDGKSDFAVFDARLGLWTVHESRYGEYRTYNIGGNSPICPQDPIEPCLITDFAQPGDYDNDGKVDPAVWDSSKGKLTAIGSLSGILFFETETRSDMTAVPAFFTTN